MKKIRINLSEDMQRKRPGGPMVERPHWDEKKKKWIDPYGQEENITPDEGFAREFWRNNGEYAKETMIRKLKEFIKDGKVYLQLSSESLDGKISNNDRMMLSAYRVFAKNFGYNIGQFKLKKETGRVVADISK